MSAIENRQPARVPRAASFSTGAFVLAARVAARRVGAGRRWRRSAPAAESRRLQPERLSRHPARRHGVHRHPPLRDGHRHPDDAAAGGGRRARGRLEPRAASSRAIGDTRYGDQNTDGSRSIRDFYEAFRVAGASARDDAGQRGGGAVERAGVRVHGGEPRSGAPAAAAARIGYGALVPAAAQAAACRSRRTLSSSRRARGSSSARTRPPTTSSDIVTGKAQFGLDVFRDGMVHASIEHPPVFGGTVRSVDDKAALAVKGVQQTVTARHVQAAVPVPAARRRGRDRRQHLGGAARDASSSRCSGRTARTRASSPRPSRSS